MSFTVKSYSKKQAGAIYRAVKCGNIVMSDYAVNIMYRNADAVIGGAIDRNQQVEKISVVNAIRNAVNAIMGGDYETAQESIDYFEHKLAKLV